MRVPDPEHAVGVGVQATALAQDVLDLGDRLVADLLAGDPPADVAVAAVVAEPLLEAIEAPTRVRERLLDLFRPESGDILVGDDDAAHGAHDREHQAPSTIRAAHRESRIDCSESW